MPDMRPWGRQPLTIPPNSRNAWIQLAIWELWMGMLVCVALGLGVALIATAPNRIVAVADLTNCYAPPPVALPCERIVYRGGALNAAFTSLCGPDADWRRRRGFCGSCGARSEPKPITDDFLQLLHDSFGRDWRNPLTWPWARVLWAYGFTVVGVALTAGVGLMLWTFVVPADSTRPPTVKVQTSQSFTLVK